ncbi:hypothetical protein XELAEV_18029211mg [Xenopus laevis]|uniref:Uncharacterized protein n=1 Tax=Xenopus laevis TaxID=8355 RepID=A0A974HHW1_XENLA|nr:hypothetical protein XELAEV_18029211mg [Xenopus laevis]
MNRPIRSNHLSLCRSRITGHFGYDGGVTVLFLTVFFPAFSFHVSRPCFSKNLISCFIYYFSLCVCVCQ